MMKERYLTKDIVLVLAASFFFMASPMMVTPLLMITIPMILLVYVALCRNIGKKK